MRVLSRSFSVNLLELTWRHYRNMVVPLRFTVHIDYLNSSSLTLYYSLLLMIEAIGWDFKEFVYEGEQPRHDIFIVRFFHLKIELNSSFKLIWVIYHAIIKDKLIHTSMIALLLTFTSWYWIHWSKSLKLMIIADFKFQPIDVFVSDKS